MEFEQMIRLIETVSSSELSCFTLEEGNLKIALKKEKKTVAVVESAAAIPQESSTKVSVTEKKTEGYEMKSPLVGTFYNAPSPDAEAFVKVGDRVTKGQTLGIIEAMKLMNEIECEQDGVIKEILVDNQEMVEYGQTLFVIGK
ncbi:MAG: acetyl-CoA carboxylase biotin carboxyl carrier protein [Lachnospiraceae bacterium]|nr:acetyl-CoA carboxylase biotin carboxyl carrier protein [Lachnospiraceae bacterium]